MKSIIITIPRFIIVAIMLVATARPIPAQPRGWPCDYGFRPGNVWFYRSTLLEGGTNIVSVLRDSIGADGAYWILLHGRFPDQWFRFDSSCVVELVDDLPGSQRMRWFVSRADSGSQWSVVTAGSRLPLYARLDAVYHHTLFGLPVVSKSVVYYRSEQGEENWHRSEEWAEGLGIVEVWGPPQLHEELIGAIIDGVRYGATSGIDDTGVEAAERIMVHPVPASDLAVVSIAGGESGAMIEVYDMLGRRMLRERLADGVTTPLDVSGLAPGAYIVAVEIGGVRYTTPLIIAR